MKQLIVPERQMQKETTETKARWFQSLSIQERQDLLCYYTDLILDINPRVAEKKNAQPVAGRILVLREA